MTKHALHFWWLAAYATVPLSGVNYTIAALYLSIFSAKTNVHSTVPREERAKAVFDVPPTAQFMPRRLRPM